MRFGLFGGAKVSSDTLQLGLGGDSVGLSAYIDYVLTAEELDFSNVFMVEHHFTGANQVSSSLGLLTYLAGITKRIRLGTAVIVLPWHNPAILAEEVAILDILSNGRFDFGIGRGYRAEEFSGFGIPIEEAQERFDETFAFLRKAWTSEGRFDHRGKYWTFNDVIVEPRPRQLPHPPFWMAAGSPGSLKRAAADGVNLLLDQVGSTEQTIERLAIYRQEKARLGLPFDKKQVALTRGFRVVANEAERVAAREEFATWLLRAGALKFATVGGEEGKRIYLDSDAPLIGTPDQIIDQLRTLEAGGIETVLLGDMAGSSDSLRLFAAEVMPAFAPAVVETTGA